MDEETKDLVTTGDGGELMEAGFFGGPTGFEQITPDCMMIPFLKIAQSSTDQAKPGSMSRIQGLEVGQFFNPTSRKVYGNKVRLVLLKFYRTFLIYDGETTSAKFLGSLDPDTYRRTIEPSVVRKKSYFLDQQGHRYVDSRNLIVLNYDALDDGPMLFAMSSSGITPSRKLMTLADAIKVRRPDPANPGREVAVQAPLWSSVWELETAYFDNPLGSYYQVNSIERAGWLPTRYADEVQKLFTSLQGIEVKGLEPEEATQEQEAASPAAQATESVFGRKPEPAVKPAPGPAAGSDEDAMF